MATTFLEPGGDATFTAVSSNGFWTGYVGSTGSVVSDITHGTHLRAIRYASGAATFVSSPISSLATAGSRVSLYIYISALPTSADGFIFRAHSSSGIDQDSFSLRITSGGVLQLWSGDGGTPAQIGSNGSTLSTGIWYRLSLAYTITSTTINRFELFKNGVSDISITNATLNGTSSLLWVIGKSTSDTTFDFRSSDHYADNSTSLTDTGDIWVTAKRPNANGTTNGFTTQIGAGGSGYGTGHSPQVNERPLSTTNGWSMVGAGSTVTEEYNIESKSTGDIDISNTTSIVVNLLKEDGFSLLQENGSKIVVEGTFSIVDYVGWASMGSVVSETVQMIVNGVNFAQLITNTQTLYTKIAGSSSYPAGTGADIGITTSTTLTTVSLYECGVLVAYIPASNVVVPTVYNGRQFYQLLGVGT
jgi:hypothetical protein